MAAAQWTPLSRGESRNERKHGIQVPQPFALSPVLKVAMG